MLIDFINLVFDRAAKLKCSTTKFEAPINRIELGTAKKPTPGEYAKNGDMHQCQLKKRTEELVSFGSLLLCKEKLKTFVKVLKN